ncbi:MAG: tetratricopeptide repeat protein [Acidobacteria bacterium]|nr:tetratricopeptide repeat protein [Acidobacteriota bacterium]
MKTLQSLCLRVSVARILRVAVRTGILQALLLLPGRAQPPSQQAEDLLQQADAALQKEDYASASAALETYLAQKPEDYRARFNLALAYSMTGRQGEAIRLYQEILLQQADLIPARVNLGILLLQQGNSAEALVQFERVVDRQPDHWAAQVNRAGALLALERNAEAAQAYQRALELKPDHAPTHMAYGQLLATTDPAAAESHLRRALELDPALEDAKLALAGVLEDRAAKGADTLGEAVTIYQQLLAAHPDQSSLRIHLGEIYLHQKRYPDVIRELEAVRSGGSKAESVNRALLEAYLQAKANDKALALLPELLAQNPGDADLHMLNGSLLMEKRQYPDAAASFRRAIELAPQSPQGHTNLASALYLMKDYEGTVAALASVAALGQDTAGSYFLRAISLDKLGMKAPAYDNYQMFLESDGKKNPDQEFQARQRSVVLGRELKRSPRR